MSFLRAIKEMVILEKMLQLISVFNNNTNNNFNNNNNFISIAVYTKALYRFTI